MKYLSTGTDEMPALGAGTWQLKGDNCTRAVQQAVEIGYRHIDTAQIYGNEAEVGQGIENSEVNREELFLTTKVWRDRLSPEKLKPSVEESLEKLGTDYVDLLLIHWPFPELDLKASLEEMSKLVDEGQVRNIGVSNFTSSQLERAKNLSRHPIMTNQVEYHPFLNQDKLLEKTREIDSTLTAYSPLARGEVIGNKTLEDIGNRKGKSAVQVALRWLVQQEGVAAIPKASSREHLEENFKIFDFSLDQEEMERISKINSSDRKVNPDFSPDWD